MNRNVFNVLDVVEFSLELTYILFEIRHTYHSSCSFLNVNETLSKDDL